MTIAKNTNRAKKAIANATDIRCYSLSNNFSGKPLGEKPVATSGEVVSQSEFLSHELAGLRTKLTMGENGRYCIHVHSNLWYEFTEAGSL